MIAIIDSCTDPYINLAAEEHLLENFNRPVFRLWRNAPSIIIGRNQNAFAEINLDFVGEHSIPVVRRLSGGGAVFHDLGNINFTFIDTREGNEDTLAMFARFTAPIIKALDNMGINAVLSGRNDITIDGQKISGNAIYLGKNRVLQHGTLLFDASMEHLSGALKSRPEKFTGKAVQSVRSRVTNIRSHLAHDMDVQQFMDYLGKSVAEEAEKYSYSANDKAAIEALANRRYRTDEWNYGHSPTYNFSRTIKFPSGLIELYLTVTKGVIQKIDIHGDYFFTRPTTDFCQAIEGCPHTKEEITRRINELPTSDFFNGATAEELVPLFFI